MRQCHTTSSACKWVSQAANWTTKQMFAGIRSFIHIANIRTNLNGCPHDPLTLCRKFLWVWHKNWQNMDRSEWFFDQLSSCSADLFPLSTRMNLLHYRAWFAAWLADVDAPFGVAPLMAATITCVSHVNTRMKDGYIHAAFGKYLTNNK